MQLTDQLLSLWENSGVSVMQQLLLDSSMHVDMDPQDLFVREEYLLLSDNDDGN